MHEPPLIPTEPEVQEAYMAYWKAGQEAMHANTARNKARGEDKEIKHAEHAVKLKKYHTLREIFNQLVNPKIDPPKIRRDLTLSYSHYTLDIEAQHLINNQLPEQH
jgi:hypothetical protein